MTQIEPFDPDKVSQSAIDLIIKTITTVSSAISECGSGYYGRGWEIAPHIVRLRRWIIDNNICVNIKYQIIKEPVTK